MFILGRNEKNDKIKKNPLISYYSEIITVITLNVSFIYLKLCIIG